MLTNPAIINTSVILFKKDIIKKDVSQFIDKYRTTF